MSTATPEGDFEDPYLSGALPGERDRYVNGGRIVRPAEPPANEVTGPPVPDPIWADVLATFEATGDPEKATRLAHTRLAEEREASLRLRKVATARATYKEALTRRAAEGLSPDRDVATLAELRALEAGVAAAELADIFPPVPRPRIRVEALGEPTPIPWVVEALGLVVGRPLLFVGYAGSAKSIAWLSAALSMALGRPIWGAPHIRPSGPLRVLYVDLDFGRLMTEERLRQLKAGMGDDVDAAFSAARKLRADIRGEVEDTSQSMLEAEFLSERPDLVFASEDPLQITATKNAWIKIGAGFDVVIVDPLWSCAPTLNENLTVGALPMVAFKEASERSGAAFVVLHHAGKASATGKPRAATQAGRGTSAIDGAAFSKFVLEVENPDDPPGQRRRKVTQAISRTGAPLEAFYLSVHGAAKGPLVCEHQTAEQVAAATARTEAARGNPLDAQILAVLKRSPGLSGTQVKERVKGEAMKIGKRIVLLSGGERVVNTGSEKQPKYRIAPDAPACTRCAGSGEYQHFGECFRCLGSGVEPL